MNYRLHDFGGFLENKLMQITNQIFLIRDQKVMLDSDLAELYGVTVSALNQAVKRNKERFPEDFSFQLDSSELARIKSQSVICSSLSIRKGVAPTVFSEQGAYALSFVLRSKQAIEMGIFIARAFVHLRRFILKNENLFLDLKNLDHLTKRFKDHERRIEQDLTVVYKNLSQIEKRFLNIEKKLEKLK